MARLGRYFLPGRSLHVIQRGNNREPVFFEPEVREIGADALRVGSRIFLSTSDVALLMWYNSAAVSIAVNGRGHSRTLTGLLRNAESCLPLGCDQSLLRQRLDSL